MIKKLKKEQLLIGGLVGILLLVVAIPTPDSTKGEQQLVTETIPIGETNSMEEMLEEILQKISGVGAVEVFISYEDQGKIIVEKDLSVSEELIQEADSNGGNRTTTTTRNESETVYDKTDAPYVVQEISPTVKGVLVVAQGAGDASVKSRILETIQALFGLEAHKISIMKMEVTK